MISTGSVLRNSENYAFKSLNNFLAKSGPVYMKSITCLECEQTIPPRRLRFLRSLWNLIDDYYCERSDQDIEEIEAAIRINGCHIETVHTKNIWEQEATNSY